MANSSTSRQPRRATPAARPPAFGWTRAPLFHNLRGDYMKLNLGTTLAAAAIIGLAACAHESSETKGTGSTGRAAGTSSTSMQGGQATAGTGSATTPNATAT